MATEMAFVASALLTQQQLLVEQQAVLQQLQLQQLATPKQQHDMVLVNVARSRGNSKKLIDKCDWAHPHPQQDSCCIHWVRPSKRRNASCRQQHGWPTCEASNSPDGCSQVCAWP